MMRDIARAFAKRSRIHVTADVDLVDQRIEAQDVYLPFLDLSRISSTAQDIVKDDYSLARCSVTYEVGSLVLA
jgi:hypothetical protein